MSVRIHSHVKKDTPLVEIHMVLFHESGSLSVYADTVPAVMRIRMIYYPETDLDPDPGSANC